MFSKSFLLGSALFIGSLCAPAAPSIAELQNQAHGTLPNGKITLTDGSVGPDGITNVQLLNFNENFEVAYFTSLVNNLTQSVPGYTLADDAERTGLIDIMKTILAQETLHQTSVSGLLQSQNQAAIEPCKYIFPTTNLEDALSFSGLFTSAFLGTLGDVTQHFATRNPELTRVIAAVLGQEGEQSGFYRFVRAKTPSELPFLTTGIRDFSFSFLQRFIVPGSCPNANLIKLNIYGELDLLTKVVGTTDELLQFSINPSAATATAHAALIATAAQGGFRGTSMTYINSLNVPVTVPLQNIQTTGNTVTFEANFPYTENLMNGITIAALTNGAGPFAGAQDVADATLFGPFYISVN